jgi:holin-like protein
MKYIRQFSIILFISFLGEVLHAVIPLPIPASIYGIIILFAALQLHILPLSAVKETGSLLIEWMPIMFIPAAVGLLETWGIIRNSLISYLIVMVVSTIIVMVVSGLVTQLVLKHSKSAPTEVTTKPEDTI